MNYDRDFVEYVVQEVMRRLVASGLIAAAPASVSAQDDAPRELVLQERLITMATIVNRLDGIRRLVVPRRAVISPSAKDELRSRNIELRRE